MEVVTKITLVAFGSALGGLARWGAGLGLGRMFGHSFPWATLIINVSGSFFLGWFATLLTDRFVREPQTWVNVDHLRLLVAIGFTGAYTTFSTYEFEGHQLLAGGETLRSLVYLIGSVVLGLIALHLGALLARV